MDSEVQEPAPQQIDLGGCRDLGKILSDARALSSHTRHHKAVTDEMVRTAERLSKRLEDLAEASYAFLAVTRFDGPQGNHADESNLTHGGENERIPRSTTTTEKQDVHAARP
ncbi:hypothetical protein [Salinibacter phage M8CC-19]|uniref:Uncharacterized protein n=1 Tax=Salinibacter phage M8CC-19 TaxID=2681613 RepID=A0A2I6UGF7_9CAUD|nr:hypothetical protein FGG63_gp62 [Salinibacter phage M8CC-19]AUO78997.1 hypothetical protein [Salinibacter phage M8CC-19]